MQSGTTTVATQRPVGWSIGWVCLVFSLLCVGRVGWALAGSQWLDALGAVCQGGALALLAGAILWWSGRGRGVALGLAAALMFGYLVLLMVAML